MGRLFEPFRLGKYLLRNRVVMAPMTRARNPDGVPNDLNALYYRQRASAGLIVTEGVPISPSAEGFLFIPGLFRPDQIIGWRKVTDAVHAEGGTIFAQLWHVGRVSHVSNQPGGIAPVSSTEHPALHSEAWGLRDDGTPGAVPVSTPRALSTAEVAGVIEDFAKAAANAIAAGFDGVELHGANGYLIEQFLNPNVNDRTDAYRGDTLEGRTRFVIEAIDAVIARIGAERTAIRLSPYGGLFDMQPYPQIEETYLFLADAFSRRGLAYVHLMDQKSRGSTAIPQNFLAEFRTCYKGALILAGGLTRDRAETLIAEGMIDLAAFGEPFIANPDLVARLEKGLPLALADRSLHYGGGAHGYTDYSVYHGEGVRL
ncbi:alkene reductase [Beijerinckia indica]|uniref:NADH:flavin oxidoreductase/NADH oxidase n=1 Tax=Beijerinckia indica subsp. indica (strain ATCC 9039 / DSM 1715 / NCIMB 8712) TaxID=395963 RepID=B2IB50_BEII9|nr:alkene reductase [Beijerinckia indica]ACB93748.1 NADH:flavin oxidoreductase/NADH oxidase [Beijerinckia indica subsp. indica ATCC 9039]